MAPIECVNGVLVINDPGASIQVAEHFLRQSADPRKRQAWLTLATSSAQYVHGLDPTWARPDVPIALSESVGIFTGALALQRGDESLLEALCAYGGVLDPIHQQTAAGLLYEPTPKLLAHLANAERPVRYLLGAAARKLSRASRQAPQAHMAELNLSGWDAVGNVIKGY